MVKPKSEFKKENEEILDPTSWKEQFKMLTYWIVRLPLMFFDRRRKD
jgi:hypothetical protein